MFKANSALFRVLIFAVLPACGSTLIPFSLPKHASTASVSAPASLQLMAGVNETNLYTDQDLAHARFLGTVGITNDGSNLYVTDVSGLIKKINLTQNAVTVLAGSRNFSMFFGMNNSTDGTGKTAIFKLPYGIQYDSGTLFFADEIASVLGKVDASTGNSVRLAGSTTLTADSTDNTGNTAQFSYPIDVANDSQYTYTVEFLGCVVRKTDKITGNTTTLAGDAGPYGFGNCGFNNATGTAAQFANPTAIAIDLTGLYLYISDGSNHLIRKVNIATRAVTTLAGLTGVNSSLDGNAATATFSNVGGLVSDGTYLYATDLTSIRKIDLSNGTTTTLAGSRSVGGNADSTDGTGATARFTALRRLTLMGTDLYATDDVTVRKVSLLTGNTTTVTGGAHWLTKQDSTDSTGATARFSYPGPLVDDGTFTYVTDSNSMIRKINSVTGATTTLAGVVATGLADSSDGTGATAKFNVLKGLVRVGSSLYAADMSNQSIRKVDTLTGNTSTLAGQATSGWVDGSASVAKFYGPSSLVSDGSSLYVTDTYNYRIRKVDLLSGTTSTLAGSGSGTAVDGSGSTAKFGAIQNLTLAGNFLYVSDADNFAIRKVDITNGTTTTFAGALGTAGVSNGIGSAALFSRPGSITTDGTYLYVTDLDVVKPASFQVQYALANRIVRSILLSTGEVKTYIGPGGVYDYALSSLPDLSGIFYGSSGLIISSFGGISKFQ